MNSAETATDAQRVLPDEPSVDLAQQLAFLGLTEQDSARLQAMYPKFADRAGDFIEKLYRHLSAFETTARLLLDSDRVARLKQLQFEEFDSLLQAHWDEQYIERRQALGHAHADVGLDPQLLLGVYNQYIQHCITQIVADDSGDAEACARQILSLIKAVFLDLGLTLNAYYFQATERLRQALDMYWKANLDLRQSAQLTSHDLKTPIATIANLCDEVLDEFGEQLPKEARDLIATAQQRSFQISKTIDELLTSSLSFHPADSQDEVSSEVIIREAVERLQPQLEKKHIEVQLPSKFPYVWGNRVRLREAFYNLLSNSAKFMDKSPGLIQVDVTVEDALCVFTISDNGPGIPEDELIGIFAPFRRLEPHRDHPGSGLGLYFTKYLIEKEGGQVWAKSRPGEGSHFHVALNRGPGDLRSR
jgi:signal transduction histidine kinase